MENTNKTAGKTATDGVGVTETQKGQQEDIDRRIWLQTNFQKLLEELNLKELEEVYHQVWKQTAEKLLYRIADEERISLRKEVEKLEIENNKLRGVK